MIVVTNDSNYVNLIQNSELNYHLEKVGKRKTKYNRSLLLVMGEEFKMLTGKVRLTHHEFHFYVNRPENLCYFD